MRCPTFENVRINQSEHFEKRFKRPIVMLVVGFFKSRSSSSVILLVRTNSPSIRKSETSETK